jgi:monovalent cation/hydrogen antiporter
VPDIELLILLLLAAALLAQLAARVDVPYPVFLVLGGLALAAVPGADRVLLAPDTVFLVFLPPLLYAGAFASSPRDLRAKARPIALLAIALVVLTVGLVAVVARLVFGDELSWPMAFVLGAVLAPTDPVAAVSVFRSADVPEGLTSTIEGEALVNDGVGLTLYRVAVGAATSGAFSVGHAALELVAVAAGGIAIGLAVAWIVFHVRRRVIEPEIEIALSLFTPYAAYIGAEHLGASGVLAAVAAGLYAGWHAIDLMPETRLQSLAFWGVLAFLLESILFVLVGLQLPRVLGALDQPLLDVVLPALAVVAVVVGARMAFALVVVRDRAERLVVGWSGMRGAVSLAAALAVPMIDGRDVVIVVAFVTILVTIVGQGLTLPLIVRRAGFDEGPEEDRRENEARLDAAQSALARLDEAARDDAVPDTTVERLRSTYLEHAERAASELDRGDAETDDSSAAYSALRRATLEAERDTVVRLREEGRLGQESARRLAREIDLAESRLPPDEDE